MLHLLPDLPYANECSTQSALPHFSTIVPCNGTGLVILVILDRVRSDIGLASGCGCRSLHHGDTLVPWFGTLGGGALGVNNGKAIGNAMVGALP